VGKMYYQQQSYQPEESIYNLIPQEHVPRAKASRHVSKYPHDTPPTASTFGPSATSQIMTTNLGGEYEERPRNHRHVRGGATMGPHNDHYSDPTSYLTKQNKPPLPAPKRFSRTAERKKPNVPSADSLPSINTTSQKKNYIQQNALAAITQEPGNRPVADKRYVEKTGYGNVPKYLQTVKKEIQAEKDYIVAAMDQERESMEMGQAKMRLLPENERLRLLDNLKKKWESVNKQYQGMTHSVILDTIGKVRRKEEYEGQLQTLEKSIEKLTKKFVFVQESDPYGYGY